MNIEEFLNNEAEIKYELLVTPVNRIPDLRIKGSIVEKAIDETLYRMKSHGILHLGDYIEHCPGEETETIEHTGHVEICFCEFNPYLAELRAEATGVPANNYQGLVSDISHEDAGHVFDDMFSLHRKKRFREVFGVKGKFSKYDESYPTKESFPYNPWSKDYVSIYAQKHPQDDFAETIAVLLTEKAWRKKYQHKPGAYKKLLFVKEIIKEYGSQLPKLQTHYKKKPIEKCKEPVYKLLSKQRRARRYAWHYKEDEGTPVAEMLENYKEGAVSFMDKDIRKIAGSKGTLPLPKLIDDYEYNLLQRCIKFGLKKKIASPIINKIRTRTKVLQRKCDLDDIDDVKSDLTALIILTYKNYQAWTT